MEPANERRSTTREAYRAPVYFDGGKEIPMRPIHLPFRHLQIVFTEIGCLSCLSGAGKPVSFDMDKERVYETTVVSNLQFSFAVASIDIEKARYSSTSPSKVSLHAKAEF